MNGYFISQIVEVVGKQHRDALVEKFRDMDAVVWSVEDVRSVLDEDGTHGGEVFSDEDLRDVLHETVSDHDADLGISWETFRAELDAVIRRRERDKEARPTSRGHRAVA